MSEGNSGMASTKGSLAMGRAALGLAPPARARAKQSTSASKTQAPPSSSAQHASIGHASISPPVSTTEKANIDNNHPSKSQGTLKDCSLEEWLRLGPCDAAACSFGKRCHRRGMPPSSIARGSRGNGDRQHSRSCMLVARLECCCSSRP